MDHRRGEKAVRGFLAAVMGHFPVFFQRIAHDRCPVGPVLFLPDPGVPEIVLAAPFRQILPGDDRIPVILYVVLPVAECHALCLDHICHNALRHFLHHAGVHEHVPSVLHGHCAAGKASISVIRGIRRQRRRQILPVQQIFGGRMPPVHRPPVGVIRVVLVKEMILPFVPRKSVGVVHPPDP